MTIPNRLPSISQTIHTTQELVVKHSQPLITIALVSNLISIPSLANSYKLIDLPIYLSLLLLIVQLVVSPLIYAVILHVLKHHSSVSQAITASIKHIPQLIWVFLLSFYIIYGYMFLFIIPAIVVMIWFMFVTPIVVFEHSGGVSALLKSRELTRTHWLALFGRHLLMFVPYMVVLFAVTVLPLLSPWFRLIVTVLTSLVYMPISTTYMYVLYTQLRSLHPNTDFTPTTTSKTILLLTPLLGFVFLVFGVFFLAILIGVLATATSLN